MRFVLQRVKHASVKVDGELIGSIGRGYMVLMGVSDTDTEEITDKMVDKMCKLRIFEDENGKTNCSLADVDGEILLISQFTLYADCSHGNRPGFTGAGNPELANHLYEHALARCAGQVRKVERRKCQRHSKPGRSMSMVWRVWPQASVTGWIRGSRNCRNGSGI